MKKCCTCKIDKPLEEFGRNKGRPDGKQKYCKECGRKRDKKHYKANASRREKITEARTQAKQRNREFVASYLVQNPCVDCGETDPLFLDFDHVSDNKVTEVSAMVLGGWSIENIAAEIEKCEVRCLKCHRIQTAKRGGWYDSFREIVSRCGGSGSTSLL